MRSSPLVAALAAAFLTAFPAAGPAAQVGPPVADPPRKAEQGPPLAVRYRQEEADVVRRGLVGEWSLAPGVSAGIGLFSVTDDSRRPPEARRSWSPMDVGRRTERVAAAGLKLRF